MRERTLTTSVQQEDVLDFHKAFGHPAPAIPVMPSMALLEDRTRWTVEELNEMLEAAEKGDVIGFYDAILDAIYFLVGTAVVSGLPLGPGWDNVQRSNMAKLDPVTHKPIPHPTIANKIGKPEGWVPPEASHMLSLQQYLKEMRIWGLARQMAYARVVDAEITLPDAIKIEDLHEAMTQAEAIFNKGKDRAVSLYEEMLAGLSGVDERLRIEENLAVDPQERRMWVTLEMHSDDKEQPSA